MTTVEEWDVGKVRMGCGKSQNGMWEKSEWDVGKLRM